MLSVSIMFKKISCTFSKLILLLKIFVYFNGFLLQQLKASQGNLLHFGIIYLPNSWLITCWKQALLSIPNTKLPLSLSLTSPSFSIPSLSLPQHNLLSIL